MSRFGQYSLALSFSVLCAGLLLLVALVVSLIFLLHQHQHNTTQARLYGETVLENLVQAIELTGGDNEWLQAYVVAVGTNPGVQQAGVIDRHQKIVAHSRPVRKGAMFTEMGAVGSVNQRESFFVRDRASGSYLLRIIQPVEPFPAAGLPAMSAFVDMAHPSFFDVPDRHWQWYFLSLLGIFAVAVFLLFLFLNRRVIVVAAELKSGADRIAGGDFSERITVNVRDELGELAESFNSMAEKLGKTMVSKDFFDNILRSMADSLIVLDGDLKVSMVNQATLDLLGYSADEIQGMEIGRIIDSSRLAAGGTGRKQLMERLNDTVRSEITYRARNGREIPVLFSGAVVADRGENVAGIVCVARDIIDRKRIEDDLIALNNELIRTNDELKHTQAQLVHSAKLASLGEMAAGIAHEINQPLHIISMSAELGQAFLRREENARVDEKFHKILQQVQRANIIINHLRTFGRDARNLEHGLHDINRIIRNSFTLFRQQFHLLGIEIHEELGADIPEVSCNEIQLEQVFSNLLVNAKDALQDAERKRIVVRSRARDGRVIIEVEDSGCGITEPDKSRIFDPFFTTKEIGRGTGLGLSISYGIINDHGGEFDVESRVGHGSVFRITLPGGGGDLS